MSMHGTYTGPILWYRPRLFSATAEDNGEPGTGDWFKIEIWMGPDVDTENNPAVPKHKAQGYLGGGNVQIHQK